jgi:hypothetical protein
MDPNYRASEDHWRLIENWPGLGEYPGNSCLLELRARIEALEAAQQPASAAEGSSATAPPAPAGELLGRAAKALSELNGGGLPPEMWKEDAITVIRLIVAWMKKHNRVGSADLLEQEIK